MKLKNQKGAAAVEFAIVLPLLLILIFGMIEFGLLLYNKQVLTNASREGARAGIVAQIPRLPDFGGSPCTNPPTSIDAVVQCYCSNHLITFGAATAPTTTTAGYNANALFGTDLTVKVTYDYGFLVVVPNFIPGITSPLTLTAQTVMRYE